MLKAGRAALEKEVGDSFVVGGIPVTGIRSDKERTDPVNGTVRETVLSVRRDYFDTLPANGVIVTNGSDFWRVADARPDSNGKINIVCVGRT